MMPYLNFDRIAGNLFQGGRPPEGRALSDLGFQVLVLAANSYQPPSSAFPGLLEVIHAPFEDDSLHEISPEGRYMAETAARKVVDHIRQGHRVLTTCEHGINRSALVNAIAIHYGTGMAGLDARQLIRDRRHVRPAALWNPQFTDYLATFRAKKVQ